MNVQKASIVSKRVMGWRVLLNILARLALLYPDDKDVSYKDLEIEDGLKVRIFTPNQSSNEPLPVMV
eukprot:Awhi_evm1s6894